MLWWMLYATLCGVLAGAAAGRYFERAERRARKKLEAEVEQLRVQMAGISTIAYGHEVDTPVTPGHYGWSVPYEDVLRLRRLYEYAVRQLGVSHTEFHRLHEEHVDRERRERLKGFVNDADFGELPAKIGDMLGPDGSVVGEVRLVARADGKGGDQ